MTTSFVALSYWDLAAAAVLIVINAGLSIGFRLGLERSLLIAAVRTVVQLMLIGLVLKTLFALADPLWTALAATVMAAFAVREATARQDRRFTGLWTHGLGAGSILFAGVTVTILALTVLIQPEPWYAPRFALPLMGMIVANTMSGVALGLNHLMGSVARERASIEARLALGHDRRTALAGPRRAALKTAMMPIINAMSVAGVVSLPGMMTGQILAGADPVEAVKYQVIIMFTIAGSIGIGAVLAIEGAAMRLTDSRHRLRLERLAGEE